MKFFLLIAATFLFVGIYGQGVTLDGIIEPTVEELIQVASSKFSELSMKQSEVSTDLLYDYIWIKNDVLNEKLERMACQRSGKLLKAKLDIIEQLADTVEYMKDVSSATAIELCSITAPIDIYLYINPELDSGIQNDLMYYKSTLSQMQMNSYSLFYTTDIYTQYNEAVYGENISVESLQNYINSLDTLLSNYRYEAKSKAQSFVYKLESFVSTFEFRSQNRQQYLESMLYNVITNFQNCVYSYNDL